MSRERLSALADTCVIVAAIVIVGILIRNQFATSGPPPDLLKPGDQLTTIGGLGLRPNERTLLLVLASGCGYCKGSTPFYRELTLMSRIGNRTRVLAVFEDDVDVGRTFLKENNVDSEAVGHIPFRALRIGMTPTLVLVESGRVARVWQGLLTRRAEDEVKASISVAQSDVRPPS